MCEDDDDVDAADVAAGNQLCVPVLENDEGTGT